MVIYDDINLKDFKFWSGAKYNFELLNEKEIEGVEFMIEDCYPEGISATQLNDMFWFDFEWIADCLDTTLEALMERQKNGAEK